LKQGYTVFVKPSAEKELDRLPSSAFDRISAGIVRLASAPRPPGCQKLRGRHEYRLRFGDYRVLSFHKVVGVPDSGLLLGRQGAPPPPRTPALRPPRAVFFGRRLAAKSIKALSVALAGGAPRPLYRQLFDAAERAADGGVLARMSGLSRRILEGLPVREIVSRRRDNARHLAEAVEGLPGVTRLLPDPPEGVCPLGLPIRVARRDAVRAGLIARRVYAAVHWPLPPGVDPSAYPEAARLAAEEITLPVDQRYGFDEMDYIARALGDALRDAGKG